MAPSLSLNLSLALRPSALLMATVAMPNVATDGWSMNLASPTDLSLAAVTVSRPGFLATAAATTYTDTLSLTKRVRQVYPSQATLSTNRQSLSDYVYSTDTIAGVINQSPEVSPPPTCFWEMLDQQLVGNAIHVELAAFHRDGRSGRQVAAVKFIATDGTLTVSTIVAATTISTYCEDLQPVPLYIADIDITTLATGKITVNAEVYPWIGNAATVTKSANLTANLSAVTSTLSREFSPRLFWKDAARFASPPFAYVNGTTGVDTGTGGGVSTTAATAAASPYLTVQGAMIGLLASATTGNDTSGCRIRIMNSVNMGAAAAGVQKHSFAPVVIERDPGTTRALAIVTLAATYRPKFGTFTASGITESAIVFTDVTVARSGAFGFLGEATTTTTGHLRNYYWKCIIANAGNTGSWLSSAHDYHFGTVWTGFVSNLGQSALYQHRILRGVSADVTNNSLESWNTVGCSFTNAKGSSNVDPTRGGLFYCNKYITPNNTIAPIDMETTNAGETITGFWIVQNLIEVTHITSSTPGMRLASDTPYHGNTYACGILYNTVTGFGNIGRNNNWYDNSPEIRTHRLAIDKGNALVQINIKGDVFTLDGTHTGNFALHHGVGCAGNFANYAVASGTALSEYQAYPGIGSLIPIPPVSNATPQFATSAIWTNYQGTVSATVAGSGGGTYTTAVGSPLRAIVPVGMLSHDLAGTARAATADVAGAYV